ncbi:squalene/phytoene synthase family protein [uncultured Jatrophihabitans sp.]|uniref:squalene/phytoene synthase family protein n=1 Tax=uncultured Jatrophihabitans sp. TaxID=1610747 RepID=UPI0035C9E439
MSHAPAEAVPADRPAVLRDRPAVLRDTAARSAAQAVAENFPVALRLLPRGPRGQLARVYAFARFVDDVGDEAPGDRRALLADIAADLRAAEAEGAARAEGAAKAEGAAGAGPQLAPVVGLAPVLAAGVPVQPFLDLVAANLQDQDVVRYATFDDLLGYCALSAAPVGRIVLHLAGAATPANVADSDAVCAALQVLEHCQDVGEDARAGRIYLPAAELRAAGVAEAALRGRVTGRPLRRVVARQVDRAHGQLLDGRGLVARLSGWSRVAVAGYLAGGLATVDALRAAEHGVLEEDVRPAKGRTAIHALRLIGARHGR